MAPSELFYMLDQDGDGRLSRSDLKGAARKLGWHWREAPLFAVLDNLAIVEPLTLETFAARMNAILTDPHGPYGRVLLHSPAHLISTPASEPECEGGTALLIIDPQRSFTEGAWMQSMGPGGEKEIEPIRRAFAQCAERLQNLPQGTEVLVTRCPFPPESYAWDRILAPHLEDDQIYFVKPGNSALWPPTNGYREWILGLPARGMDTLIIGGCTLNSCVRVTAMETQSLLSPRELQVEVDLDLCGARASNYRPSPLLGGFSPVASAVQQMIEAGARVVGVGPQLPDGSDSE
jgi:nicotinamidase-related amidase